MHSVSQTHERRLTRAAQQALTRQRVLDAADTVFTERGFHAARLEDVAELAGYTRGAVYSNFKDKNDLALAIIERRIAEARRILDEVTAAEGDSLERAQEAGIRFSRLINDERPWGPLFLEFVTHTSRHPDLARRLTDLYRGLADSIADVLRATGVQGGPGRPTTERLALVMLAATDGAALEGMIDPERADSQLAGEMLGFIVAGMQSAASAQTDMSRHS
jgi:AcrR family transcriptional regulator